MRAEYFLDTNIVVYAFDQSAPDKRDKARALMAVDQPWAISWQVVQEFSAVALHRFAKPLSVDFLSDFTEHVLWPHCRVHPSLALHSMALRIHQQTHYRYYDALIVSGAIESGARTLYTEDLQDNRSLGDLRIANPFR